MDSKGKISTIFIILIGILLMTLTAMSTFLLKRENDTRKEAELLLNDRSQKLTKAEESFNALLKEKRILEEKHKEADDKINGLLDELELQKGLKEELKAESTKLKDEVAKLTTVKTDAEAKFNKELERSKSKVTDLEGQLALKEKQILQLESDKNSLLAENKKTTSELNTIRDKYLKLSAGALKNSPAFADPVDTGVELEPIVVMPDDSSKRKTVTATTTAAANLSPASKTDEGRILSVDPDTEFVILNLGEKHGISTGSLMDVYRGQEYLGEVKITRVQLEMSAADIIPPLNSQIVRQNDQVIVKQ